MELNDGRHVHDSLTSSTLLRLVESVQELPQVCILEHPSKRRRRDRIGRVIAKGEQPAGVCVAPLIRQGGGPVGFLQKLPKLQHPAVAPPPMPYSWIQALTLLVTHSRHLHAWREAQMQQIRVAAKRLQAERVRWAEKLHPDVKKVIGHVHLPLLDWLDRNTEYYGVDYVKRLMLGKPSLGEIPRTGAFHPERNEATVALSEWIANPRCRNERMISYVRSSGDDALDAKAWEKTMKEVRMNYCEGPGEISELNLDKVCLTPRWPKWEQKESGECSCRNISDWKTSGGNETVALGEKYSPEDLSTAHAVIRILKEVLPTSTRLKGFRVDWEMAYRQDPEWPTHSDYHYELVWNPGLRRVQWIRSLGGSFGNKAAQSNFVEHPHFICHVSRIALGIPLCPYSDDMWNIEPETSAMQSHALVLELMDLVGWRYDQIKSPPPAETFRLLGVDRCLGLQAVVWVCKEKINKLWRQVQYHRRCGRVTAADASALHGSFNWIRSSLWGRSGAAILTPLRTRQRSGRFAGMNSALLAMLSWLEYALMYENGQSLPCEIAKVASGSDGE